MKTKAKATKKAPMGALTQEELCVEVVADLREMIDDEYSDTEVSLDVLEGIMKDRGIDMAFIREVLDSRKIEEEKLKNEAFASIRAAYKKLPKHLKQIIEEMSEEDVVEAFFLK